MSGSNAARSSGERVASSPRLAGPELGGEPEARPRRSSSVLAELDEARRVQAAAREEAIIRDFERFLEAWGVGPGEVEVGLVTSIEAILAAEVGLGPAPRSRIRFHHAGTLAGAARVEGRFLSLGARRGAEREAAGRYVFVRVLDAKAASTSAR